MVQKGQSGFGESSVSLRLRDDKFAELVLSRFVSVFPSIYVEITRVQHAESWRKILKS